MFYEMLTTCFLRNQVILYSRWNRLFCIMRKLVLLSFFLISCWANFSLGQHIGVGQWRMHLPFNNPLGIEFAGPYVYSWSKYGFYRYDRQKKELEVLSKINGFTDFQVSAMKYNSALGVMFIAYDNSNIDLLWDDQTIESVVDIYQASVNGSKQINEICFYGDYAFLSCGFGIHVYDLKRKESSATYYSSQFTNVNDAVVSGGRIYAATDVGIFSAPLPSSGISVSPSSWQMEKAGSALFVDHENENLYSVVDSMLFKYDGASWQQIGPEDDYRAMVQQDNKLLITTDSGYTVYEQMQASFFPLEGTRYSLRDEKGELWYASVGYGVIHVRPDGNLDFIFPEGPHSNLSGKMLSRGGKLWVAGGKMLEYGGATYTYNGFYLFEDGRWYNSIGQNIPYVDTIFDIHALAKDPNSDDIWMAGLLQGVFRLRGREVLAFYNASNSPLSLNNPENVTALAFDKSKNLWVGNFSAATPLLVKTPGGIWDSFSLGSAQKVLDIVIDRNNKKWIRYSGSLGVNAGIVVYDDNYTPLDKSDDSGPRILSAAAGSGGLPDNQVNCITMDRTGQIWVGTAKGLAVFFSPGNILSNSPSDARQIVLEGDDGNLGYLLGDESITAILVDGGNRKWIASRSGLWLVSADGQQVLSHFNAENSPLLSNNILEMALVEETGELFIATDKGLISYRTASSEGGDGHGNVKVFPNPVRPEYDGLINISGLPENAYVKITDISGNLIYETRSEGGTASWDGRNFSGRKASTGVYLVFSSNRDASDTYVSKILFIGR
jgi:ligand-binding sensor domain-containing protein